jgi:hypothetical protein
MMRRAQRRGQPSRRGLGLRGGVQPRSWLQAWSRQHSSAKPTPSRGEETQQPSAAPGVCALLDDDTGDQQADGGIQPPSAGERVAEFQRGLGGDPDIVLATTPPTVHDVLEYTLSSVVLGPAQPRRTPPAPIARMRCRRWTGDA